MTRVCVLAALLAAGCNLNRNDGTTEPAPAPQVSSLIEVAPPPHLAKPVVELTPAAVKEIQKYITQDPEMKECYLRVRVVPSGCQGFMHKLDLDPVVSGDDRTFEASGVKVVIAERQVGLIRGSTVDFGQENGQVGFKVKNPNFEGKCAKNSMEELKSQPVAK